MDSEREILVFSLKRIGENLSIAAFLILFPGFFFYHYAAGRGYMPSFLGGYFGVMAVGLLMPLLVIFFANYKFYLDKVLFTFACICFLIFSISLINYFLGLPVEFEFDMLAWSMSGLLFNIMCFVIGSMINFRKSIFLVSALFLVMCLLVVVNIGEYGIFNVRAEADNAESVATYQGFARSLVFSGLIVSACHIDRLRYFIPIILLTVFTLFFNGARSEFAAFALSAIVLTLVQFNRGLKYAMMWLVGFLMVGLFYNEIISSLPESRMLNLLALDSDGSFNERTYLLDIGLGLIARSPLLGEYGGYVNYGGVGSYPHNITSAWVNLGLFGFLAYTLLYIFLIRFAISAYGTNGSRPVFRVFIIFLTFSLISLIASKDYSYMATGFLLGLYINCRTVSQL